jgi:3-isopropylmalate/(R)-2-methylmalate dehydratase small subunit
MDVGALREPFTTITSVAAPLLWTNVDTDVITPMRRLTVRNARPLEDYAFEAWRYTDGNADTGVPLPEFVLNDPRYANAEIALTGDNFGCGSSRETAPSVLYDLGFRALIGTSFGDIFFNNCIRQGLLPIVVSSLDRETLTRSERPLTVDLTDQRIHTDGVEISFEVNSMHKETLLEGLDPIALSLKREAQIAAFQQRDRLERPWVYTGRQTR